MNSIIEKEKKLSLVLTELKKLNLKNPELQSSIENLNQKKNQLEIEKKGLEDNYRLLKEDYDTLSKKLEEMKSREKLDERKQIEFSEKIAKVGTHPIIGSQINLNMSDIIGKVSLYATSEQGYKNLTKLSSLSYLKNNRLTDPFCSLKDLTENNKGLIFLTGNHTNFFGKLFY